MKTGRDVERLRPLYEQNAASQLDLDNAIAAYESAKANVAMSKADLAQADLELPEGATLERLRVVTDRSVGYLKNHPAVDYVQNVTGSSPRVGTNQARSELTVILTSWEERKGQNMELGQVMDEVGRELLTYPETEGGWAAWP